MQSKESIQFKITLTAEEYEILKQFSEHQGKPMAACLMSFIREANVFKVLSGANNAMNKIVKIKNSFRKNIECASDDFSVSSK